MGNFNMLVSEAPGAVIAKFEGDLDINSSGALERSLLGITARKSKLVVIDLSGLKFISSLAMGHLVAFRGGMKRSGGRVIFAATPPPVLEAFKRARLHELFEFADQVEQCLPKGPAGN